MNHHAYSILDELQVPRAAPLPFVQKVLEILALSLGAGAAIYQILFSGVWL